MLRGFNSEHCARSLGIRIEIAENGASALAMVSDLKNIDLLITDVVMPGMTGRVLADRAREIQPGLPVLYMTGYTRSAIIHNGIVDAGVDYILKPFSPDALGRKVHQVLTS